MSNLKNKRLTIFWILLGVLAVVIVFIRIVFCGLQGGCGEMKSESHLISNNYVGVVRIVFNSKDGKDKETQNHRRIYRIPKSGVLYTKFSPNTGWLSNRENLKFFYFDSMSNAMAELIRVDWPEILPLDKIDSNSIVIRNFGYRKITDKADQQRTELSYKVDTLKNFPYINHYIDSLRGK